MTSAVGCCLLCASVSPSAKQREPGHSESQSPCRAGDTPLRLSLRLARPRHGAEPPPTSQARRLGAGWRRASVGRGDVGCGPESPRGPSRPGLAFQIILVSSSLSDGRQNLFLSTDEGSSFRKQVIPFSAEKLIFHPKEEDKVLVTTKDSKVSRRRRRAAGQPLPLGGMRPWAGREGPGMGAADPLPPSLRGPRGPGASGWERPRLRV